jgi:hypothetical protein
MALPSFDEQRHAVLPPRSLAIAAFSTIVEWYDFTLYLYFATVLARVFYGGGSGSLLLTLGGFAIAYLMRPLGALFFSHIGDRRGRRRMMLLSVAMMTAAMLATALLPTRSAVGPAAGWLLLLLRCVMGFSVGGEYTGVVAYLLEGAPARRAASSPRRRRQRAKSAPCSRSEFRRWLSARPARPSSIRGPGESLSSSAPRSRQASGSPDRPCTNRPSSSGSSETAPFRQGRSPMRSAITGQVSCAASASPHSARLLITSGSPTSRRS